MKVASDLPTDNASGAIYLGTGSYISLVLLEEEVEGRHSSKEGGQ
jgi:hypothetical protein